MSSEKLQFYKELTRLSLENAEQWAIDARLLADASSSKHAFVLMQSAYQEIAKFLVCWHVSEGIWPAYEDNMLVRLVFGRERGAHSHAGKNHILFGFVYNLERGPPLTEGARIEDYIRDVKYHEKETFVKKLSRYEDKLRQACEYVDVDWETRKILTLQVLGKYWEEIMRQEVVMENLQGLDNIIKYMKKIHDGVSERDKKKLRDFYKQIPMETWKTGDVPIEWFEKISTDAKSEKDGRLLWLFSLSG